MGRPGEHDVVSTELTPFMLLTLEEVEWPRLCGLAKAYGRHWKRRLLLVRGSGRRGGAQIE